MRNKIHILIATLFAALFLGCCTGGISEKTNVSSEEATVIPEPEYEEQEDCSGQLGKHSCNFELSDQYGNRWELYDHYGDIIVLDFSTVWCGVCQYVAQDIDLFAEAYKEKGVIWVTILLQDIHGLPVSEADALEWATVFKITHAPVLAGDVSLAIPEEKGSFPISVMPTFVIIDRDMVVSYVMDGWNESRLLNHLNGMLTAEGQL